MSTNVLVVDDDINVRMIARNVLGKNGYRVLEAASGDEAIRYVQAVGSDLKAVLLDYAMPDKDGGRVYSELTAAGCKATVIVCTGHDFELTEFIDQKGNTPRALLRKPYDFATLLKTVEAA
jgi:CheY-like chemotaxis protein